MDSLIPSSASIAKLLGSIDVDSLARESGFSKRTSRKVTPELWLRSLIATSRMGKATFSANALSVGLLSGATVSKQSLQERMNGSAVEFLSAMLAAILRAKLEKPKRSLGKFRRILVEDSTSVHLPAALARAFPGSANQAAGSATLKIHAVFELISRRFEEFRIEPYSIPDQKSAAAIAPRLGEGDLIVRDLGYFSAAGLRRIEGSGASYLSRFYGKCVIRNHRDERIDLLAELRRNAGIDREILLGEGRMPCRIVALRVPAEVGERRRRRLRGKRRKEDSRLFALQDWSIYVTNAGEKDLPARQIESVYRQRWAIEILFKSWKSGLNLSGIHSWASCSTAKCLVLIDLILSSFGQAVILPRLERSSTRIVSPCRLAAMMSVALALCAATPVAAAEVFENLRKHCFYEKRKKPNQRQILEKLLT